MEEDEAEKKEKSAQSVLDFTFKKLAEAITHPGKRPAGETGGAGNKHSEQGRLGKDQGTKEDDPP